MNRPPLTSCDCAAAGFCSRHGCTKTPHWHQLCRRRQDYFDLWEQGLGPGQTGAVNGGDRGVLPRTGTSLRRPRSVAVVAISHNYGRFLKECLTSVLSQSRQPDEVVVIDDRSTDDTRDVAESFSNQGVRYVSVDCGNVHQSRAAGLRETRSDVICFLDADDLLPQDYLAGGMVRFSSDQVGVVYSDIQTFGAQSRRQSYRPVHDAAALERDNHIHAGSLVRREALDLSDVFAEQIDPLYTQGDWFLWRRVLREGWVARRQTARYRYRQHGSNWMRSMRQASRGYYEYAGLQHETVTLFVPLSGRRHLWPELAAFLERQTWPHGQVQLVLLDTSQDPQFSRTVRSWAAGSDYPDVRCVQHAVGHRQLADDDRRQRAVQDRVRLAMARIYNRLAREVTTDYAWVVEDDILPPDDACERLLRTFDARTASVSGVYLSRFDGRPCVWNRRMQHYEKSGSGVQTVFGNGFGCVILRGGLLRNTVFTATEDYDRAFYREVNALKLQAKVDWSVTCGHRSTSGETGETVSMEHRCECPESGWCERHQCHKTPHWHRLCRTRADYFQLWEEGRGPGQDHLEPKSSGNGPGIVRRIANFGRAVVRHAADGARKVSGQMLEQRLAICRDCPHCDVDRMVCREKRCGCRLPVKARWQSETCPLDKWPDSAEDEPADVSQPAADVLAEDPVPPP